MCIDIWEGDPWTSVLVWMRSKFDWKSRTMAGVYLRNT